MIDLSSRADGGLIIRHRKSFAGRDATKRTCNCYVGRHRRPIMNRAAASRAIAVTGVLRLGNTVATCIMDRIRNDIPHHYERDKKRAQCLE